MSKEAKDKPSLKISPEARSSSCLGRKFSGRGGGLVIPQGQQTLLLRLPPSHGKVSALGAVLMLSDRCLDSTPQTFKAHTPGCHLLWWHTAYYDEQRDFSHLVLPVKSGLNRKKQKTWPLPCKMIAPVHRTQLSLMAKKRSWAS